MPGDLPEVHLAGEAVEWLKLLDGVALDTRTDRLPHDAIEVDEDDGSQKLVQFISARAVPAHEPLHGGRLVRRVVIDVHAGVAPAAFDYEVDQPLEGALLLDR